MLDRRSFVMALPALGWAATARAGAAASAPWSPPECVVFTRARQQALAPNDALRLLEDGNERFVTGRSVACDLRAQVRETANGTAPFAAVVGCIDSRVPPEIVFDQRLGDIVCARVAGNFVNDDILGSLEIATRFGGAKVVVVLGHSECGTIKSAIDGAKLGYVTAMLRNFAPAIKAVKAPADASGKNATYVQAVAEQHARISAHQLTSRSEVLRALVARHELRVVAAMHDVATGRVTFLA